MDATPTTSGARGDVVSEIDPFPHDRFGELIRPKVAELDGW